MKRFGILIVLILILSVALVACTEEEEFKVFIHPNNGGDDVVWNVAEDLPSFSKDGYTLVGYYLDGNFTTAINPESLKQTGITANVDIYIKWEKNCDHQWGEWHDAQDGKQHIRACTINTNHTETADHVADDSGIVCIDCGCIISYYNCDHQWKIWQADDQYTCSRVCKINFLHVETSPHCDDDGDGLCDKCQLIVGIGDINYNADFQVPLGGYDGSEVTITFYHSLGGLMSMVLNQYVDDFNSLYPNINVECYSVGSFDDLNDTVNQLIEIGHGPNIVYGRAEHILDYKEYGAVVQLDNLMASTEEIVYGDGSRGILGLTTAEKADFIEGFFNSGKQFGDGKMYSMPLAKSTEVLYYNKTFFEANSLKVPTTWEEMEEVARTIKALNPECTPLGYDSETNCFMNMCEQLDSPYFGFEKGNEIQFDNDTNKGFLKELRSWYKDGLFTTQELYGAYTSSLFINEGCYMSIASSSSATHMSPYKVNGEYPFEVGVAPIPQSNPDNAKVISQGPSLSIISRSDAQEIIASWLFIKFLTTNAEFQADFAMATNNMPVINSAYSQKIYADFVKGADGNANLKARVAKVCMEQRGAYFAPPATATTDNAIEAMKYLMLLAFDYACTDDDMAISHAMGIAKTFY